MKKKKILIIHTSLGGGGAEKVLIDILKHFDYCSYEVTLFLLYKTGVHLNQVPSQVCLMDESYGVRFPRIFSRLAILTGLSGWLMRRCAHRVFKGRRYDTIVSFMEGGAAKFHGYITANGLKNVSWVHINLLKNHYSKVVAFPWPGQERRFYKKMDEIVFVSQDAKTQFQRLFGLDKGIIIYNLIDRTEIRNRAEELTAIPPHRKFTFVNVGRLAPQKRQDRIIEVATLFRQHSLDADFWIVGAGELESTLKRQAAQNGVDGMVHFFGFKKNPYPYIKAADCFLLTSDTEGFPLVVAEAMCIGKPIISTRVTGPEEMLDGGKYGILTSLQSEEIAEAAMTLFKDSTMCENLARKATERACAIFDVDSVMRQIYAVVG